MKETEIDMKPKEIMKHNTELLEKLYYIYFKIIRNDNSKYLIPALKGILKYIHLINFDLIIEIMN